MSGHSQIKVVKYYSRATEVLSQHRREHRKVTANRRGSVSDGFRAAIGIKEFFSSTLPL